MCILPRKTKKCSSGIRGHVSGNLEEIMKAGWSDGCSPRGPGSEPQLPHDSSPPSITPVLGDPKSSSAPPLPLRTHTGTAHKGCTDTYAGKTHILNK